MSQRSRKRRAREGRRPGRTVPGGSVPRESDLGESDLGESDMGGSAPGRSVSRRSEPSRRAGDRVVAATGRRAAAGPAGSALDGIMDRAAHPGRLVTWLVVLFIVVAGWKWPRYVVDPLSAGGAAHRAVAVAVAVVLFLSFSTLTILAYCLLLGSSSEVNKRFLGAVLNRAGIGATLGTVLGIRLAPALLAPATGAPASLPDYLSDVGNAATLLTLVLISTAWPYSVGPLMRAVADSLARINIRVPERRRRWVALPVLLAVNGTGVSLAWAVLAGLLRR